MGMTERTYTADEVDAMIARALAREREKPQSIEHCLWARNGNTPCPHVQPAIQQGWQPIETAPKDGTWVILARSNDAVGPNYWTDYWIGSDIQDWAKSTLSNPPTHWMPLPAAPTPQGEKK